MSAAPDPQKSDADLVCKWLTYGMLGAAMPSKDEEDFARALHAIEGVVDKAARGEGGADVVRIGMHACVMLLHRLRASASAEQTGAHAGRPN
jgi:hypothetical protein